MIHFVTGKPRAGKSRFAMMTILNWIRNRPGCPVVTNLAIRFDPWYLGQTPQRGLANWYYFRYLEMFPRSRIKILKEDETPNCFLYRWDADGQWTVIPHRMSGDLACEVDWSIARMTRPCLYLLDECNRYWDSRQWQARVKSDILKYCPLNGQLSDEVYLLTQHKDLVDVGFRRLAQDYMELRNYRFEKFLTLWRSPNKIRFWTAQDEMFKVITEKGVLHHPDGLQATYSTSGGVGEGVDGLWGADTALRAKGAPLWTLIAAAAVIIVVCSQLPKLAGAVGRKFSQGLHQTTHPNEKPRSGQRREREPAPEPPVSKFASPALVDMSRQPPTEFVISGISNTKKALEIWTIDGEKFDSRETVILRLKDLFLVNGRVLAFRKFTTPRAVDAPSVTRQEPPSQPQFRRQAPSQPTTLY